MEQMLDAFLDFARSEATDEALARPVADMVDAAIDRASRAGHRLERGEMPDNQLTVKVRQGAIERALDNLVGNAVRYANRFRVSARETEDHVHFVVEDDGPGIPDELVETIFDVLNAKAAILAALDVFEETGTELPLMVSVTFTQLGNARTLCGMTIDAFWATVAHAKPFSVGINCALGAREIRPYLA